MRKRKSFNHKRRIRTECDPKKLKELAEKVSYGGNPEHKRNPGNFNLTPPAQPRADKTLCDNVGIFSSAKAKNLLKKGIRKGMISEQERQGYPRNIWSVTSDGEALEAQLENPYKGVYHGYPMPDTDPMRKMVLEQWEKRDEQ